ncbi:MAG TPA: flagellar basal body-associated FliL family protein [Stellaceae bacterium]|nr:flagellar basal body-associated FliL family protein [Stellaceae bacterium]
MTDRALDDETEAESEEAQEEAPKSGLGGKRRLIIFGGAALLLLAGTGGVLYFTGLAGKLMGSKPAETADAGAPPAPSPKPSVFLDLPDLLVNLNSTGRKASFLKISVSLDLEDQADTARIQAVMPRIIDNFQVYLRELRVEDLRGSGGIYRLREELLARVNAAAAPVKVKDVLFKEMLVQ